ncbi:MAG: hypothetical protein ACFFA3_20550 [Promethearchaeota archaeon]
MVENKSSLFGIIAIIIGASGLGVGAYSIVNFQTVEGPQGPPGDDGQDGSDAPGGLVVGILDPDQHETVWGEIEIRALVYGSNNYSVSVKANQTKIRTKLPTFWNTSLEVEGWYNLTVLIMDNKTKETASDMVWIQVKSPRIPGIKDTFTLTRTNEKIFVEMISGWESVMTFDLGLADMWVDLEVGDTLYLSFTGEFREPAHPGDYLICFFDYGTYSPIGDLITVYLDDTYREVSFEREVFSFASQNPGIHRLDVCIYEPYMGIRNKNLEFMVQIIIL